MQRAPKFLIVTAMKNEAPYIIEWIAHHLSIGFEHFIVVTNDCADGTDALLDRLQDLGIVTHLINPKVVARDYSTWQTAALRYAQHYRAYKNAEWILHLDVDEFVQPAERGQSIAEVLDEMGQTDVLSMTSVAFNSGGALHIDDELTQQRYTQTDRHLTIGTTTTNYNGQIKTHLASVKTLFRNDIAYGSRRNHRPVRRDWSQTGYIWRDGSGEIMPPEFTDSPKLKYVDIQATRAKIQFNHYAIRNVEAFLVKVDRGDVMGSPRLGESEHYFRNYDSIGDDDLDFAKIAPSEQRIYQELMGDPEINALHQSALSWHKSRAQDILQTSSGNALARKLGYYMSAEERYARRHGLDLKTLPQFKPVLPENAKLPEIASSWIGGPLSFVEIAVIESFLQNGHKFILYTLEPLENIPAGVELRDPREIFAPRFELGEGQRHNNAVYTDIFRLHMIKQTGAVWADMDAYCVKPFVFPTPHLFGIQYGRVNDKNKDSQIANGIVGLPQNSAALDLAIEMTNDPQPIPEFFNKGRKTRLQARKESGESWGYQDFSWGVSGPRLLTHVLEKSGEIEYAQPKDVFYPGSRPFDKPLLRPEIPLSQLETWETVSVHIFGKTKAMLRDEFDGIPPEGSYLDLIAKRHGIDPRKYPV